MAGNKTTLEVKVVSDVENARKGLDAIAKKASELEGGLKKAAAPAAGVVAALGLIGKAAYDSASELQQSAGAVESVFGSHAAAVEAAAETAASSVGLAASEYENMSAILGAQLKNMGTPMDELAGQTGDLIGLGADLAATFGGTTADAVAAVSSLLRGERDPIEKYGVSIKQADINARMAAEGLDGLTGDAARTAEAQVTLALLTEQTASAQGQFARETDSAAGAQQIAAAQIENAKAALGEHLLPALTRVSEATAQAAQWTSQHSGTVLILAGVIGGLAGVILAANAAMTVYRGVQTALRVATVIQTGAQAALNAVMAANPAVLVVAALAALAAGLVYAYQNSETFRNGVNGLWEVIKSGASKVMAWIQPIIDGFWAMVDGVQSAYNWVRNLFSNFTPPAWLSKVAGLVGMSAAGPDAGMILASSGDVWTLPALGGSILSADRAPGAQITNINIEVNGALDPVSVAEQIRRLLTAAERRTGAVIIGAAR
ncbi:hypothetical protein [Schaalia hyovaginalis]|uniref:hypothetical protein n=1 Tax=Schaalia hyovaginalis TaxID=29316 RepID=UPI0026EB4015|nr:hypothetical protein [Schaalia hyovaginalis]MCI6557326.1 hypothetical protein [Schaalia hyovaginalis]